MTTPTVEKTQAQAIVAVPVSSTAPATTNAQQASSNPPATEPNLPATMVKADDSIKVEAKAMGGGEDSAIADHPPPAIDDSAANPATNAPAPPSSAPSISPELSSVLSNLQALAGNAARRDSVGS